MTRKGVWNLQQVRDKYLQELWEYNVNLFSWGNNDAGQLGLNDKTNRSSPTQIPGGNWQVSGTGNNESRNIGIMDSLYSIKSDGTLWAWGENTFGALGQNNQGNPTNQSSPIQIGSDTTWSSVGGGYRHGTAVKTDGTLWSWGYNYHGLLGQNNETHYSSPVQVGSDTNWSSVASGNVYTYGRKTDGTLWAWGNNANGTLGQNSSQNANRSSPVQIPGTNWSEQYCSNQSTVTAIKTDGTLWAWGRNWEGQLGQNEGETKAKSSPVQIPGSNWAILARGSGERTRNPIAVKTDGTLWVWGSNDNGGLGQNNLTNYSSPIQVGTDTTWSTTIRPAGTRYGRFIACIKSDNTLWVWGSNATYGNFGINQAEAQLNYRSSPVQVPGTRWNEIYMTGNSSIFGVQPNLTPSQL